MISLRTAIFWILFFVTAVPHLAQAKLEVDPRLRKNVDFWVRIYSYYGTNQGVIHDAKYVDKIYEVLNHTSSAKARASEKKWTGVLLSLHRKLETSDRPPASDELTDDEKKVVELFEDIDEPNKFLKAAHRKRVRFQLGQKERFLEGIRSSGEYLPKIEEIFAREGVPLELTRLPFVESGFNLKARSKVGASGIWQFMRSTGRLFLRIDDSVDERNDPLRAAAAAAKLLKQNYQSLHSWPLAVTAYNHGRKGMMRAVRKVGSLELEDLVEAYRGRSFGFASGNFYACLMAAVEVERNAEKYFGRIERNAPVRTVELELAKPLSLRKLARSKKLKPKRIAELNPALSDRVIAGKRPIPAGYRLRLPVIQGTEKP